MGQVIDEINKHMGQPEAPFKVASKAIGDERLSTFDYTFTGLLAFSLMSMGVFGLANQMPTEKQKGSYRRLRAAPFTAGQLIIATAITYTIISIISAAMMIIVGMLAFKFQMRGNWLLLVPFLTICAAMMTGIGLAIGAWAKNENQSSPLSNLISFPMMFLSGAFFPAYLFPEWLQGVSKFIPMAPVVDGFRLIMAEKACLIEILPQVGGVLLPVAVAHGTVEVEQRGRVGLGDLGLQGLLVGAGGGGDDLDGHAGLLRVGSRDVLEGLLRLGLEVEEVDAPIAVGTGRALRACRQGRGDGERGGSAQHGAAGDESHWESSFGRMGRVRTRRPRGATAVRPTAGPSA